MNLRSKVHLEVQKIAAEKALAAQLTLWKERGLDEAAIGRTPSVRQAKAAVRKVSRRLARIAAMEGEIAERARLKAEKALAPKRAPEEAPAEKPQKKAKKAKKEE